MEKLDKNMLAVGALCTAALALYLGSSGSTVDSEADK